MKSLKQLLIKSLIVAFGVTFGLSVAQAQVWNGPGNIYSSAITPVGSVTASNLIVDCGGAAVTTSGGDSICTYTNVGADTFSVISGSGNVWYVVIAGGGGGGGSTSAQGGGAGGGAAGGYKESAGQTYDTAVTVAGSPYAIVVGDKGAGSLATSTNGANGGTSSFGAISADGGGGGASSVTNRAGSNGGSGGGAFGYQASPPIGNAAGGTATAGQGHDGGKGNSDNSTYTNSGAGGGSTTVGGAASSTNGGTGGDGTASSITGVSVTRAAGGGGGASGTGGTGGTGGGGNGGSNLANGTAATPNTGSGGGGAGNGFGVGKNGGDGATGTVIIRCTCTVKDQYFANVKLLLANENATNGSTSFLDQSSLAASVTRIGTAVWSNTQAPTGLTTTVSVPSGTSGISVADSSNYAITGDFTLEGYVWFNVNSATQFVFTKRNGGAGVNYIGIYTGSAGALYALITFDGSSWAVNSSIGSFTANTWVHYAFVRSGGVMKGYVNGVATGLGTNSSTVNKDSSAIKLGLNGDSTSGVNGGYMGPTRLTVGTARYTSNFAVPTPPFRTQ